MRHAEKLAIRWALVSVLLDALFIIRFGWADFTNEFWWKSLAMAILVLPFWYGLDRIIKKAQIEYPE